jgi:preprotein translocase subunit SecG
MGDSDSKIIQKTETAAPQTAPVQNAPATPAAPATK